MYGANGRRGRTLASEVLKSFLEPLKNGDRHGLPFAPGPTCPGSTPRGRDSTGLWPAQGRPGVGTHFWAPCVAPVRHSLFITKFPGVPDPPPHSGFRDAHIKPYGTLCATLVGPIGRSHSNTYTCGACQPARNLCKLGSFLPEVTRERMFRMKTDEIDHPRRVFDDAMLVTCRKAECRCTRVQCA